MTTKQFIQELLDRVEKNSSPYLHIGPMDRDTCDLVSAAHNLGLAIWQPTTRQVYVRIEACERYVA